MQQLIRLDAHGLASALYRHSISPNVGIEAENAAARVHKLRTILEASDNNDVADGVVVTTSKNLGSI